jgi:hypothetical protein
MNRRVLALGGLLGAAGFAVVGGLLVALGTAPKPETATPGIAGTLGLALGVVAFLVALVRSRGKSDGEPAPWTDRSRLVDRPPEETPDDVVVSGSETAETLAAATRAARSAGDVEAGVEQVRPRLRRALGRALVAGGRDPEAVERALADGTWTDDDLAAAVLDPAADPPPRTLRGRLGDWLFPERAVRERTRRAVAAVDEAAGEALPTVVGEDAPRTVPVLAPALEDLQRTADGRLQRAGTLGEGRPRDEHASAGGAGDPRSLDAGDGSDDGLRRHGRRGATESDTPGTDGDASRTGGEQDATGRPATDWGDVPEGRR